MNPSTYTPTMAYNQASNMPQSTHTNGGSVNPFDMLPAGMIPKFGGIKRKRKTGKKGGRHTVSHKIRKHRKHHTKKHRKRH